MLGTPQLINWWIIFRVSLEYRKFLQGHASEMDVLTFLVTTAKNSQEGRLHAVQVGDHHQLPSVNISEHDVAYFLHSRRDFHFKTHTRRLLDLCWTAKSIGAESRAPG